MRHILRVKRRYLSLYEQGKDLEIRTRNFHSLKIAVGDVIVLSNDGLERTVKAIRHYRDFPAMLQGEDPHRIAPGYSKDFILQGLRTLYSDAAEQNGVLVFELGIPAR